MSSEELWAKIKEDVSNEWDTSIVPALSKYIEVPNQSPDFDPEWKSNGLTQKAFTILIDWVKSLGLNGVSLEYIDDGERTPFLMVEIAGTEAMRNSVLMYGHMDKQPPLYPWGDGLDPYKPAVVDGKLYGRGASDDGYAVFTALQSIYALQKNSVPHGKVNVIIESCEESGSFDLPYYMDMFKDKIGDVDLMICLDSGCLNYDQIWLTTSLRGVTGGILNVQTLTESMHSGVAGGVVPDTFRIIRTLLDRVEDAKTGEVLLPEAHCEIPEDVKKSLSAMNSVPFKEQFALFPGVHCTTEKMTNLR
ncbi:peptidase M20/M25/M40 [Angomonas deanei]|nr:peptidase M20/M25/M40 [Angomonas deanei]EPY43817.1 peptidase M20/M25/M40 [Angomonas deanei]|eukprot:EPY28381.1 peptidase M20/M25/M40 [Angomonas deanei]